MCVFYLRMFMCAPACVCVYVYMHVWTCVRVPASPIPAEVLWVREVAESLMVFGRENNI